MLIIEMYVAFENAGFPDTTEVPEFLKLSPSPVTSL
jgi:hypothetical protein